MTPLLELPTLCQRVHPMAIDEGKAAIYAEAGIPEYWIVRPDLRAVTVRQNANLSIAPPKVSRLAGTATAPDIVVLDTNRFYRVQVSESPP